MPRVVAYIPYLDEKPSGMQRFASETVRALHRHDVDLAVIVGECHGRPAWLDGVTHRVVFSGRWVRRAPRPLVALARVAWLQVALPFEVGEGDVVLLLAHETAPFPLVDQVAVVHDLTDYKPYSGRASVGTAVRNALWRTGLLRSKAVVAISRATRQDLVEILDVDPARVRVIYEGVDRTRFAPLDRPSSGDRQLPERPARPFLLYVGTLDPHKNVPFLLRVYQRLLDEGSDVDLVLAGRYSTSQAEAHARTLSDQARRGVRWLGFVDDDTLAGLLAASTAFVFPSRNEGFGLAAAEAMACGAAVVSSDAGSLREVVATGGVLLSPDDLEGWVSVVRRVLASDDYRDELRARARARADAFSWDRAAAAYADVVAAVRRPGALPPVGAADRDA